MNRIVAKKSATTLVAKKAEDLFKKKTEKNRRETKRNPGPATEHESIISDGGRLLMMAYT